MSKIAKGIGDLSVEVVTTVIGWDREGAEIRVHSLMTGEGDANPTAKDLKPRKKLKTIPYCSATVNSACFATMRATKENQPGAKAAIQRLGYLGMLNSRANATKTAQGPFGPTRKLLTSSKVIAA